MPSTNNPIRNLLAAATALLSVPTAHAVQCTPPMSNLPGTTACVYVYADGAGLCPADGNTFVTSTIDFRDRKSVCFGVSFTFRPWSVSADGFLQEAGGAMPAKLGVCPDSSCNEEDCQMVDFVMAEDGVSFSTECFEAREEMGYYFVV